MPSWKIHSSRIEAEIHSLGGMVAPVVFTLDDGRRVEPLKMAPWSERTEATTLPPVMRYLRGDFACIPFGAPVPPPSAPERWTSLWSEEPSFRDVHGPSANREWELVSRSETSLTIGIDYPEAHPVRRVERTLCLNDKHCAIDIKLVVLPRRSARIAIGVHPVLEIGDIPGDAELFVPFRFGWTFPGDYVPGISRLARDTRFESLAAVPLQGGQSIDLRRHPLDIATEEVVQLCGTQGFLRLKRASLGIMVGLRWNAIDFPSLVLGIANAGRKAAPFDGQWRALYLEPSATAFGMGSTIAANDQNPIAREGITTWVELTEDRAWSTRYHIDVTTFVGRSRVSTGLGSSGKSILKGA